MNLFFVKILLIIVINYALITSAKRNGTRKPPRPHPFVTRQKGNYTNPIPAAKRRVIIFGLNKTEKNQVDIKNLLVPLIRDQMNIKKFHPNQLIFVRRLGKKNDTEIKPVMVIFNDTYLRERMLAKRKKLHGLGIGIEVHQPKGLRNKQKLMVKLKGILRTHGEIQIKVRYGDMWTQQKKLSKLKVTHLLSKYSPDKSTTPQKTYYPGQIITQTFHDLDLAGHEFQKLYTRPADYKRTWFSRYDRYMSRIRAGLKTTRKKRPRHQ